MTPSCSVHKITFRVMFVLVAEVIVPVLYWLSTTALVGGEWLASRPGLFTLGEEVHVSHWIGGWVGPRLDLNSVEKGVLLTLPTPLTSILQCPVRSQSLHVVLWKTCHVSDEYIASMFMVEAQDKLETSLKASWRRWFISWFIIQPWRWWWCLPPKRRLIFKGLQ
jgi:hypothetical protein